ncbi:MAG: ABC transporter ATP-binding protein [Desulfobulbus sp.]|nr:MAG: ABC transporter ATP-binding protein [Desulfobulbus sp.]RUM40317.1 MAG: ABC transporter ATP-binding protein [Desulfobulbus sp.]
MGNLSAVGITKTIGHNTLLSDISFSLEQGEILGLIGPNGAGKTTLLECLAGLLAVDSGKVCFNTAPLPHGQRSQYLWYQPDDILPFAQHRVATTLHFFQKTLCQSEQTLLQLIERLDLSPVLTRRFQELSKGYKRRVLLAIALLSQQPLLLLDEPFDGFDLRQTLSIIDLLRKFQNGRTFILSIHQLTEAEKICDRFLLLVSGKVLALGTLADLCLQAGLPDTATLEEVFLAIT